MPIVIGLTGGIGCGKTLVSDHFASLGVPVIDTDVIARQIVEPGQPVLAELSEAFGKRIINDCGELNRNSLRKIAFSNSENKQLLDSITHPAIRVETRRQIKQTSTHYCLVVVPLLTKKSVFIEFTDRIAVVVSDKETKISRVMQRSQLSREETLEIMDSQISDNERLKFADDVIDNNGTIKQALTKVESLHKTYLTL